MMKYADKFIITTTKAKIVETDVLNIATKGEEILKPKLDIRKSIGETCGYWTDKSNFRVGDVSIKANKSIQVVLANKDKNEANGSNQYQYSYLELNEGETFNFTNDGEEITAMNITSIKVRCDIGTVIDLLVTYI
ncbi:MAG: hypothetical protein ACRDD7_09175 [Peptostreptococcaceae bacterium]